MDVRRFPADRSNQRQPAKGRAPRFVAIILSAGILSGVAAMLGIWPFSGLQALATTLVHGDPSTPAAANSIFATPSPQHKTVDVYDPPKSTAPSNPELPPSSSAPTPEEPNPEPSEPPESEGSDD